MLRIWEIEKANQIFWNIYKKGSSNEFETKYHVKYVSECGQECRPKYNDCICNLYI